MASRVDAKVRGSGTRRRAGAAMCRARLDRSSPAKHAQQVLNCWAISSVLHGPVARCVGLILHNGPPDHEMHALQMFPDLKSLWIHKGSDRQLSAARHSVAQKGVVNHGQSYLVFWHSQHAALCKITAL